MQRHLLGVLCFGGVLGASVAWTQDPQPPVTASNQDLINVLGFNFEEAPPAKDDVLREQLQRLVEEQSQLMNREELEAELSVVQDDIGELQAGRKLEEARRILSSIVQEHAGTDGAAKAQHMLHAASESRTGAYYAIVKPEESLSARTELSDSELRQKLLETAEEKAQLMDRDALQRELAEVQDGIVELQALRRLEEARRILSLIVEEQEGTEGAARAQRMVDTDDERTRDLAEPRFNPI